MRKLTGMLLVALLSMGIYSCGGNGQKAQDNNDKKCCAEHKHEHGKCDGHHHKKGGECPLQLTEEQKAKFKELNDKKMAENAPIMESLKAKNEELHNLLKADEVDLNAANALVDEIYAIKANLRKAEMANQIEFNKLLTPEQKAKMKEMPCPHRHGHHHGCKGEHHHGCCKDKKEGCCKDKKEGCAEKK